MCLAVSAYARNDDPLPEGFRVEGVRRAPFGAGCMVTLVRWCGPYAERVHGMGETPDTAYLRAVRALSVARAQRGG